MATKKLACEEAADYYRTGSPALSARLRAEGRKIAQYERIALQSLAEPMHAMEALQREAKRIQKARTKK